MKFDTKIDTTGFKNGTNTIKSQANALKSTIAGIGKALGIAFGITTLIAFGKQAINTASDLVEVQNVVDTAFGDMSYKIEEFSKSSIKNFGLSELASKQMASTYMAMSTGMGQMASTASDMAVEITGRLGDVMSFYNKTASEADTIGKAIYTGETEPLKAIGIVMTQTNLNAYALSKGMTKAYDTMSSGEQLLVRQQYFLEQTSLAAGDFVKTSGSWANQTRVLSEQWKQFLGILGNGLIQVLTPAIQLLNSAMSYMITFAETAGKVLSDVFGLSSATGSVAKNTAAISTSTDNASTGINKLGKSAKKAGKDADKSTAGFDKLNNLTESVAGNAVDAADSIGGIGAGTGVGITPTVGAADTSPLEKSLKGMAEKIKTILKPASEALDRLKVSVTPFAKNVGAGLKWFFDNVLVPFGTWTISKAVPTFLDLLGAAITVLNSVLVALRPLGLWLWNNFLQPIASWTGGIIITALQMLTDGLYKISDWILANQETVRNAVILIGSFFAAFKIAEFITTVAPFISVLASMAASGELLSIALGGIASAFGIITSPVTIIATLLGLLIYSFIDLYKNSESFREALVDLGKTWLTALKPLADFIGTVLTDAWNKLLKPAVDFFVKTLLPQLIKTFENLWKNVLVPLANFIGVKMQPVFKILADLLTMIWKNVILPLAQAVGSVLKEAWDAIYQILNKTIIPILKTVITTLTNLWKNVINPIIDVLWKNLKPAFETVFSGIKTVIEGLKTTLSGIITFIKGVFTGDWKTAWEGIKKIFKGVFDTFEGIVKTPIKAILKIVYGMIYAVIDGFNTMIKAINHVSFKVPDWVPKIGGSTVGFNLNPIDKPKIPKLATGTVVPANYGEFLSILGDNTREAEIVSPLSTMKQAFKEAMAEMGGSGSGELTVNVYLSGKQIHTEVVKQDKEYKSQTGKSAFAY